MAKGKHALLAANRRAESAQEHVAMLMKLRDQDRTRIRELEERERLIAPLQKALDLAHHEVEAVTNPKIRELEDKNAKLRAKVAEIDKTQKSRERLYRLAKNLLVKYEEMTEFEAAEFIGQQAVDADVTLMEHGRQRRMGSMLKPWQRARGLRRKESDGED